MALILVFIGGSSAPAQTFFLGATALVEGPSGGTDSVILGAFPAASAWTAAANASWLHLSSASQGGTGSTTVFFDYDANTGPTRIGTLTIAGQTLTITQAGASFVQTSMEGTIFSAATKSYDFPQFLSVALDGAGNVYWGNTYSNEIDELIVASNIVITLVSSGLSNPIDVAVDSSSNVYIADYYHNAVKEWIASSNVTITLVSNGLNGPSSRLLNNI